MAKEPSRRELLAAYNRRAVESGRWRVLGKHEATLFSRALIEHIGRVKLDEESGFRRVVTRKPSR